MSRSFLLSGSNRLAIVVALAVTLTLPRNVLALQSVQLSHGQQLESLIRANDLEGVATFFEPVPVTCPGAPIGTQVCNGQSDGSEVTGYRWGTYNSEGGLLSREQLTGAMRENIAPPEAWRLKTVSSTGYGDCATCTILVYSPNVDVNDSFVSVLIFQIRPGADLSVHSGIGGFLPASDQQAMLKGGALDGRIFVPANNEPGAPATGSGLASDHSILERTWTLASFVAVLVAATTAIAAANQRLRSR